MHILEPQMVQKRRARAKRRKLLAVSSLAIPVVLLVLYVSLGKKSNVPVADKPLTNGSHNADGKVAAAETTGQLKTLSGNQFQRLYESLALPNTEPLVTPPSITGDTQADQRIRQIAESRGYKLRSVPIQAIVKTGEPGLQSDDLLQPNAYEAWQKLKAAAKSANVPLALNSGYRSIEWQRNFFISLLRSAGVSNDQIKQGSADNAIVATMRRVAPPGYSRHHTGYTIDLKCGDGLNTFENTSCFKWLHNNNYEVAKKTGWIPSYPDGVNDQGPEPESWEYVWVGPQALYQ